MKLYGARKDAGVKPSSAVFTEGFYYKPRIDFELLSAHSGGLIASSACLAGKLRSCQDVDPLRTVRFEFPKRVLAERGYSLRGQ